VLGSHDLALDEDVELPFATRLDARVYAELILDLCGETRRTRLVASGRAVEDLDVDHFFAGW
jgi:hypothetical protein